jgi:glycosyltransferase involved in cell wall biosynthesis
MRCPTLNDLPPAADKTGWPWTEESPRLPNTRADGSPWPKVSVVTPSYNSGQFIEATIRSILLQGYPDVEYIIIDGASTDESREIIRQYESWLAYWVSEADRGQSDAINKGIRQATGDIVFWINADDLCLPGAFASAVNAFAHSSQPMLVVGQAWLIDESGQYLRTLRSRFTSWQDYATRQCTIRQISTFFKRSIFMAAGLVDDSLRYTMDHELLLRLTSTHPPYVIKEPLAAFRRRRDQMFNSHAIQGYHELDLVVHRHLASTPWLDSYRQWSALHWWGMAQEPSRTLGERMRCLSYAITQLPTVFLRKAFWTKVMSKLIG